MGRIVPAAFQKGGVEKPVLGRRANSHPMLRGERERVAHDGEMAWKAKRRKEEEERSRQGDRCCLVMKIHMVTNDIVPRTWTLLTVYIMAVSPLNSRLIGFSLSLTNWS